MGPRIRHVIDEIDLFYICTKAAVLGTSLHFSSWEIWHDNKHKQQRHTSLIRAGSLKKTFTIGTLVFSRIECYNDKKQHLYIFMKIGDGSFTETIIAPAKLCLWVWTWNEAKEYRRRILTVSYGVTSLTRHKMYKKWFSNRWV